MPDRRKAHVKKVEKLAAALGKWLGRSSTQRLRPIWKTGHNSATGQKQATSQNRAMLRSFDQVNAIRVKAELARRYAQTARLGLDMQNLAAEVRVRAERSLGEMLIAAELRGGDRQSPAHGKRMTLADFGIDPNQSSRWQREAAVPERVFEEYLARAKRRDELVTSDHLLRLEELDGHASAIAD